MKRRIILAAIIIAAALNANAQIERFQALYTYNICRYVEWPSSYGGSNFVIGVYGNNTELIKNLNNVAGSKKIASKNIVIKEVTSQADADGCHVVFFSKGTASKIGTIGTGQYVLILSENKGATKIGSAINFYMEANKLKFELKESNVSNKGLELSSELTTMASKKL